MLRAVIIFVPLLLLLGYVSGAFGGGYSRTVERPEADVARALENLDIRDQPGALGTDAKASGGVLPTISLDKADHRMTWIVHSGDQVAVRMIADLKPIDDTHTRVSARIERGDAPDDFVSPAFRSKGITTGLFATALEAQLDKLTLPAGDPAKCRALIEEFEHQEPSPEQLHPSSLGSAVGQVAGDVVKLNAMEMKLRRAGCDTSGGGEFHPVEQHMSMSASEASADPNVNFTPGKPMIDVSKYNKSAGRYR